MVRIAPAAYLGSWMLCLRAVEQRVGVRVLGEGVLESTATLCVAHAQRALHRDRDTPDFDWRSIACRPIEQGQLNLMISQTTQDARVCCNRSHCETVPASRAALAKGRPRTSLQCQPSQNSHSATPTCSSRCGTVMALLQQAATFGAPGAEPVWTRWDPISTLAVETAPSGTTGCETSSANCCNVRVSMLSRSRKNPPCGTGPMCVSRTT